MVCASFSSLALNERDTTADEEPALIRPSIAADGSIDGCISSSGRQCVSVKKGRFRVDSCFIAFHAHTTLECISQCQATYVIVPSASTKDTLPVSRLPVLEVFSLLIHW
ncbi:uncharacterized protein [Rutidosis leptorrhynchoides]|uniref:uncharacterized protein n=1 Tax=Rutidosis leptorrhynchoides TaxID=125765 RepID=UPI003A98DEC9